MPQGGSAFVLVLCLRRSVGLVFAMSEGSGALDGQGCSLKGVGTAHLPGFLLPLGASAPLRNLISSKWFVS